MDKHTNVERILKLMPTVILLSISAEIINPVISILVGAVGWFCLFQWWDLKDGG